MSPDDIFRIGNMTAMAGWLALLISPFAPKLADRVSGLVIPALLSVTGIIIWWRARKPRQKARDYQRLAATAK